MRALRLLVIFFALVVAGNSLAAVAFAMGEGDCTAACCRPARSNKPRVTLTRDCCYSQCEEPGEPQPTTQRSVVTTQRDHKAGASDGTGLQAQFSSQSARNLQSAGRSVIQSTRVYLRTGTLLI